MSLKEAKKRSVLKRSLKLKSSVSRRGSKSLHVVPTIISLQDHFETIRQAELDRVRGRLGQLSPDQEHGPRSAEPRHREQDSAYTYHAAEDQLPLVRDNHTYRSIQEIFNLQASR